MPVMHVVTFTFASDVADAVMSELGAALDDLAPRTKAIRYYHGPDIGVRDGNAHYAVTAVFENRHEFLDYIADPEHQQIIREKITRHLRYRSAVQFDVPSDGFTS
jgi:Stress responsive A/B Barrel Domain